jgi:hypothetical protein
MAQSGKVTNPASPPFASPSGQPRNQGATSKGAHDFLEEPTSDESKGGGRDFTKESRPQSEAKPEVVPNPQEIPKGMGGKILKADPSSLQTSEFSAKGPQPKPPFKGMKGY